MKEAVEKIREFEIISSIKSKRDAVSYKHSDERNNREKRKRM